MIPSTAAEHLVGLYLIKLRLSSVQEAKDAAMLAIDSVMNLYKMIDAYSTRSEEFLEAVKTEIYKL